MREDRFGAPSDKGQNEEGGPHQSLHRVLHEKIRASSRAAQRARFDCTRYARLTLPVADEASARLSDVVVFMRCVPLLIMIRNVALAMVTEVIAEGAICSGHSAVVVAALCWCGSVVLRGWS